jgi:hypoxanthine phosphoribosyltransferase
VGIILGFEEDLKLLHQSWEDVQMLSEKVAEKIEKDGFNPDLIVAVSRGGFDPARILCDQLGINKLASLQIEYYSDVNKRKKKPKIIYPLNANVENSQVLVVDDVSDSGNSLKVAKDYVIEKGAAKVLVATLHVKPWTTFIPDYHAAKTDAWIVYPWEPIESMMLIASKLERDGLDPNEINERLVELGFNEKYLNKLH